jgi:hypothetical protein
MQKDNIQSIFDNEEDEFKDMLLIFADDNVATPRPS